MTIVRDYDFSAMNETDVREEIIRPFLHELGYRAGTAANIRTEVTFKYGQIFLGRKDPKRDPKVQGRADYILDVVPHGRWVVEAKPPGVPLTEDDAHQAHTYAAHPEVAATLYLLTNGLEWKLYRTSYPDQPIMSWNFDQIDRDMLMIRNMLGPEAIRRLTNVKVDTGKPLAEGIGSLLRILNGSIIYDLHVSADLPLNNRATDGLRNGISGKQVARTEDGQIEAVIDMVSSYTMLEEINRAVGLGTFTFRTMDEFISRNPENPTLFTNFIKIHIPEGLEIPPGPHVPVAFSWPMNTLVSCFTDAAGFIEGNEFKGTFAVDYFYVFDDTPRRRLMNIPENAIMSGVGRFDIVFD